MPPVPVSFLACPGSPTLMIAGHLKSRNRIPCRLLFSVSVTLFDANKAKLSKGKNTFCILFWSCNLRPFCLFVQGPGRRKLRAIRSIAGGIVALDRGWTARISISCHCFIYSRPVAMLKPLQIVETLDTPTGFSKFIKV